VSESPAHPSEAGARSVSHDCRSTCTERVNQADSMVDAYHFKTIFTTCMAQKFLRGWIFVNVIGRYRCTNILKTVNLSSRRMDYTHRRVYCMKRGTLTQPSPSVLVVIVEGIRSNIKVWLDYCLLHPKTEDDLLATLNFFFNKCQKYGLNLQASNFVLFATIVRHCGRLVTKDGVCFDPKNMEALHTMCEPQNGADLVQYVAAVNWMRSAIPNYSKRVAPLQAALAKLFEGKSRRRKKDAAAMSLLHLWGPEQQAAFKDLQAAIMESMTFWHSQTQTRGSVS
jgi:hypothetical protein